MILREFEVETVTLREVMAVLHGRGYVLFVMLLALPFSTPIPIPGLSTPFGLVIALIGVRLALGQKPWLPARLLDTRLA
ncbi:MAG: exopolysaccharide biosynthesis protein, partial [Opitutus sp.]